MYTTLLPIFVNNLRDYNRSAIDAPYMGAAEYEFGAPQNSWAFIRENEQDISRIVVGNFQAWCTESNSAHAKDILTAMTQNDIQNKGMSYTYSKDDKKPKLWLSMKPSIIVFDNSITGNALGEWALHYACRRYYKTNENFSINDKHHALISDGKGNLIIDAVTIKGVPEDTYGVTVVRDSNPKKKMKIASWRIIDK